jgi:hypothetical protein
VAKDVIAKDKEGKVIPGKAWGGMTSYQISYTQEWKLGLAQRRIDGILAMIPELVEGKTIHIDAFLGARPLARQEPISPYLGYPKAVEVATQRKIYRYWRDRGLDVTSEWVDGFRGDRFVGLQAWTWHGGTAVADLPDALYCTNVMEQARELWGDPTDERHAAYSAEFFLKVLPWFFKNHPNGTADPGTMIAGTDICMPALWCKEKTIIAYSKDGYEAKTWELPADWRGVKTVTLERVTSAGPEPAGAAQVDDGRLTLRVGRNEALKISVG